MSAGPMRPDSQISLRSAAGCRRAALRGALAAGLPTLALSLALPALVGALLPHPYALLALLVPEAVVPFLLLALAACTPGLLALPVGLGAGLVARHEARQGRARGLAAAAGAGLATALCSFGVLLSHMRAFSDLVALSPFLVSAGLAVGVVGALAFRAVPRRPWEDQDPPVPALYHTLTAAGLAGPALVAGGGAWAALAWAFPGLLYPFHVVSQLPSTVQGAFLAAALPLALTPFSYGSSRLLGRIFPGAPRRALHVGLLLPPLAVMLGVVVGALGDPQVAVRYLPLLLLGGLTGIAPHLYSVRTGLDPTHSRTGPARRLTPEIRSRCLPSP